MDEEAHLPIPISPRTPPSLKQKLKRSLCFYCCLRRRRRPRRCSSFLPPPPPPSPSPTDNKPTLIWLKTKTLLSQDLSADFKDKCRAIFTRRFGTPNKHKRHCSSAEFRYDPLSYSLNFEDVFDDSHLNELPLRNFSARLPPSPPPEIAAVS